MRGGGGGGGSRGGAVPKTSLVQKSSEDGERAGGAGAADVVRGVDEDDVGDDISCRLGKLERRINKKRLSLLWPGASQWRIYYHRIWGQLSTTYSNY